MISRRCISGALLVVVTAATASAAPPRIRHLADVSNLSERDRNEIKSFAGHWCGELTATDPATVDEARQRLIDPLVLPVEVGQVFRFEYANSAVPLLEEVIANGNPQAAVSAMQVAALMGTPRALDTLVRHTSIEDQEQFGIRLWAAKCFPIAIKQGALPQTEINKALRHIGDAGGKEENWLVLRRQFEAIAVVRNNVSRDVQVSVLQATTKRMERQDGPSDLMQAAYPALKMMLDEYLRLQPAQQESFGKSLAPVLCDLCTVAQKHWDSAQDDEAAKETYGGAVHISENLLRLIDGRVRPRQAGPRTELGPAWKNRQKVRFRDDHDKWRVVLSRPPYIVR
jgi:hypothetical protein